MAAEFAAELVADFRDDLDFRRMVILRVLELMNRVPVIDRVGGQMNEIARVGTQQAGADELGRFGIGGQLAKAEVITGKVQHSDVATFGRRADQLMSSLRRIRREATGEGKLRIGEDDLNIRTLASICGRHRCTHSPPRCPLRCARDAPPSARRPHLPRRKCAANLSPAYRRRCRARLSHSAPGLTSRARAHPTPDAGRSREEFFPRRWRQFLRAFRFNRELAGRLSRNLRDMPIRQNPNAFRCINRRESLAKLGREIGKESPRSSSVTSDPSRAYRSENSMPIAPAPMTASDFGIRRVMQDFVARPNAVPREIEPGDFGERVTEPVAMIAASN